MPGGGSSYSILSSFLSRISPTFDAIALGVRLRALLAGEFAGCNVRTRSAVPHKATRSALLSSHLTQGARPLSTHPPRPPLRRREGTEASARRVALIS